MASQTAVSLFAGVGGFDVALERAGVHVAAAVEIDDAARGVLHDRFPNTVLFTDVTKVTANELIAAGFDPRRGIITAGFPCQDLSVAGRRRGMVGGTRSGLFWHIVRLLADLRPEWFILENVPGLLSAVCPCPGDGACEDLQLASRPNDVSLFGDDNYDWEPVERCPGELHQIAGGAGACIGGCIATHGGAMGAVLGALGDLGYGFSYRVLDAQKFGVPQRRRRVIIVGRLGDDRGPVEVLLEPEGSVRHSAARVTPRADVATDTGYGVGVIGERGGVANTLVDLNERIAPTLTACGGSEGGRTDKIPVAVIPRVVNALTSSDGGPDDNDAQAGHLVPTTFQKVIRSGARDANGDLPPEVWAERDVAATLNLNDLGSESRACELVVQPVTTLGEHTHTLTAEGHDASEDGTGRGTPIVAAPPLAATLTSGGHPNSNAPGRRQEDDTNLVAFSHTAGIDPQPSETVVPTLKKGSDGQAIAETIATETTVRRLTPVECERLQGFPDGHTATSNGKDQSDSPRYKQMGNAVAVPVVQWVIDRIVTVWGEPS